MNALNVGTNIEPIFGYIPNDTYLLVDDGRLIDRIEVFTRKFDPFKDTFNPLKDITYTRALDFLNVLDASQPGGASTLTRQNSNYILLEALLAKPKSLGTLIPYDPKSKDPYYRDAYQRIQRLLMSDVLKRVLDTPTNVSFTTGTILARINRAELGDFDAYVLGNLLISLYPGQVIVTDFGFYAHAGHSALLQQKWLIAGINTFREVEKVPTVLDQLLLVGEKKGSHCTFDDAETLALYAGIPRGTVGFAGFVSACMA